MAKTLTIFIGASPYGYEYGQTAMKLAEAALDRGHKAILFASGDGVYSFIKDQKPRGVPNPEQGFARLVEKGLRVET